jgi:O-antigen/teichoic acid export membrane protein
MTPSDPTPPELEDRARDVLDTPQAGPVALRGSVLRSGAYVLGILLSLVSAPLLIRHLHEVQYGHYITVIALVTIVTGLSEGGVNAVALRVYTNRSGADREQLLANLLGIRIALSVVGLIGVVVFAELAGYERDMVLGVLLVGLGSVAQVTQDLVDVSLQATMRFGWVTLAEFVRQFVGVALVIALVFAGAHLLGFFFVAIPAGLIGLLLSLRLVRGLFPLRPALHPGVVWPLLSESLLFGVAVALNSVYFRLTVVVMSLAASALETGYFAISFRVVEVLIAVPGLVMGAAYPILTRAQRDDGERFSRTTRRMFELAVLAGAWLAVCLELGAGFIVTVLAGGKAAHPAVAVLRIQGVAVMFTFISVACAYPLLSLRRKRALLLANAAGLMITILLTLLLVPAIAARGAAVATVAAEATLALLSAAALVRAQPDLRLPLGVFPVAAVAAAAATGAGLLVGVHPVLEVLLGSCVYFAVIWLLGRFPPELADASRGIRGRAPVR